MPRNRRRIALHTTRVAGPTAPPCSASGAGRLGRRADAAAAAHYAAEALERRVLLSVAPDGPEFPVSSTANGSQNAIAVFDFDPAERGETKLRGLFPVGWYPGALAMDHARSVIVAANIKGLPKAPQRARSGAGEGFNSHQYSGSLSIVPLPSDEELPRLSDIVAINLRQPKIVEALLPPRPNQPPRPVPERIGEPSLIRHVVYIIKENRTYDQVFGDIQRGNGDPSLCGVPLPHATPAACVALRVTSMVRARVRARAPSPCVRSPARSAPAPTACPARAAPSGRVRSSRRPSSP